MIPINKLRSMAVTANKECLLPCKRIDLRFVESIIKQVKSELAETIGHLPFTQGALTALTIIEHYGESLEDSMDDENLF